MVNRKFHSLHFIPLYIQIAGKTSFTVKLLENRDILFKPNPPSFVVLIYESWQKSYYDMQEQKLIHLSIKGLDNMEYLKELFEENKDNGGTLIIFDDQMQKVDYNLVNIFTIYSHHLNVTCLLLTQSLFLSNKIYRVLS